jgi:putative ABC transport system permease protein
MVIGYHLNAKHNLKKGGKVQFLGREFTIVDQNAERGTVDDSTVWINLGEAQELLGKENLVSAILALECNCASKERVAEIRRDIAQILPGTQVIERGPPALARAEARNKAKKTADELVKTAAAEGQAAITREAEGRQEIETRHAQLAAILAPLVIVACAALIGLLAYGNVRQRSSEIGILRAIGARSGQILWLFLGRFLLVGICGAFLGYALGMLVGARGYLSGLGDASTGNAAAFRQLFAPEWLLLAIAVAPVLAALAAWIPALLASRQDPAAILQEN